jgi:hypothetical protein
MDAWTTGSGFVFSSVGMVSRDALSEHAIERVRETEKPRMSRHGVVQPPPIP